MTERKLEPADPDDLALALSFALRFDGRRPYRKTDELMSQITAARLVAYLESQGFVLIRREAKGAV